MPSDLESRVDLARAAARAIGHVQRWYWEQMDPRATFRLHDPVVETVRAPHPERWYATHPAPSDSAYWFWENVLDDVFALTGAIFHDPDHRWVVYADAALDPGQHVGGTSGVCLLPRHDLLGLIGQSVFADEPEVCRWVGGLAHELGHAFDLPHPPLCDDKPQHPDCQSLMMYGFRRYPDTSLLPADRAALWRSPFFVEQPPPDPWFPCTSLDEGKRPP